MRLRTTTCCIVLALAPWAAAAEPPGSREPLGDRARAPYVVVDGWAVHDGDMVLGRAAELEAAAREAAHWPAAAKPRSALRRRNAAHSPSTGDWRWPGGRIPYVVGEGFSAAARETIRGAIDEWNSRTVIELVPRAGEDDYVRFVPADYCRARLGRAGGEQFVWLPPDDACGHSGAVHEIGHAVGLAHEHQRKDRGRYIALPPAPPGGWWEGLRANRAPFGPYDYASAMHYNVLPGSDTIPRGIPLLPGGLSAGDIDGVARLYGAVPAETTIATNPPGLTVLVDGAEVVAPARFRWAAGSEHVLEAPAVEARGGSRHLFARWNDDAPERVRTVAAGPGAPTWIEANFMVQHRAAAGPSAAGGRVTVAPPGADGFHFEGSDIEFSVSETEGGGLHLYSWSIQGEGLPGARYGRSLRGRLRGPLTVTPRFTPRPVLWIEARGVPDGARAWLALWRRAAGPLPPEAEPPAPDWDNLDRKVWSDLATFISGTEPWRLYVHPLATTRSGGAAARFLGWGDGSTDPWRTVAIDGHWTWDAAGTPTFRWAEGSERVLTARFEPVAPLFELVTSAQDMRVRPAPGAVEVSGPPAAEGGGYPEGAEVRLAARPEPGWSFVRWRGADGDPEAPTAVVRMDRRRTVAAVFAEDTDARLTAGEAAPVRWRREVSVETFFTVPRGARAVTVALDAPAGGPDFDLYVSRGVRCCGTLYFPEREARRHPADWAEHASATPGSAERITISPESDPPLDPDAIYQVALAVPWRWRAAEAALRLEAEPGPPGVRGRAEPVALTFVGRAGQPPAAQTLRLTNETSAAAWFAASGPAWLAALPAAGSIPARGAVELVVRAEPAGLAEDTHRGALRIRRRDTLGVAGPELEVPVWFAVTPPPEAAEVR